MRKRVALAQSLINEPRILLMDEPFSALDVQTRAIMSNELLQLWDLTRPPVVFVTHDLEEAIALADKVVVMTAGPGGTVKASFDIDLPRPRVGAGDPLRAAFRRSVPPDLGRAARGGGRRLRPDHRSEHEGGLLIDCCHRTHGRRANATRSPRRSSRTAPNCADAESSFTLCQVGVSLVVILGGWQLYVGNDSRKIILYGEPSGIVGQLRTWITEGTAFGSLGDQIWVTFEEALLGFLIGTALGIVAGIALGRIRFLADVFSPYIKVLNSIPRIVLGSVFVLAFGLGIESKVLLVIVLVFFGVFFNAFQGVREVDRNLIANARILGASRWQVTRQVVLPSAFTWIIASLHVASASPSSARSSASSSAAHRASACSSRTPRAPSTPTASGPRW